MVDQRFSEEKRGREPPTSHALDSSPFINSHCSLFSHTDDQAYCNRRAFFGIGPLASRSPLPSVIASSGADGPLPAAVCFRLAGSIAINWLHNNLITRTVIAMAIGM